MGEVWQQEIDEEVTVLGERDREINAEPTSIEFGWGKIL